MRFRKHRLAPAEEACRYAHEVEAAVARARLPENDLIRTIALTLGRGPGVLASVTEAYRADAERAWRFSMLGAAAMLSAVALLLMVVLIHAYYAQAELRRVAKDAGQAEAHARIAEQLVQLGTARVLLETPGLLGDLSALRRDEVADVASVIRIARSERAVEMREAAGAPFPCMSLPAVPEPSQPLPLGYNTPEGHRAARACLVLLPERYAAPPAPVPAPRSRGTR